MARSRVKQWSLERGGDGRKHSTKWSERKHCERGEMLLRWDCVRRSLQVLEIEKGECYGVKGIHRDESEMVISSCRRVHE